MDELFDRFQHKFSVGDIVARKGTATKTMHDSYGTGQYRFIVLAQQILRCGQNCIEKTYRCRAFRPTAEFSDNGSAILEFYEIELESSEPFRRENR